MEVGIEVGIEVGMEVGIETPADGGSTRAVAQTMYSMVTPCAASPSAEHQSQLRRSTT